MFFFLHVKNHSQHSQTLESISSALASPLTSWPFSAGRWKRQRKREYEPSSDGRDRLLEGSLLQSFDRLRTASTTRCEKGWIQSLWEESWGVVSLRYTVIGIWLPPFATLRAPKLCLWVKQFSLNFWARRSLKSLRLLSRRCCSSFRTEVGAAGVVKRCGTSCSTNDPKLIPMTHHKCSVPQKTIIVMINFLVFFLSLSGILGNFVLESRSIDVAFPLLSRISLEPCRECTSWPRTTSSSWPRWSDLVDREISQWHRHGGWLIYIYIY